MEDLRPLPSPGHANRQLREAWATAVAVPAPARASCRQSHNDETFLTEGLQTHAVRVAQYSRAIAERLDLPKQACERVGVGALFHDIGKVGVSDELLSKPGRLTAEEYAAVRTHTWLGAQILERSSAEVLRHAAVVALHHHERYDGKGYPFRLRGCAIPLVARIVAVADVFDALRSKRPYKPEWPVEWALEYLEEQQGRHFDPLCVRAFVDSLVWIESAEQGSWPRATPSEYTDDRVNSIHWRDRCLPDAQRLAA
ncbi:MAG: HD-GYP domain-containing protein [Acidiferrobacterales bacterium]